MEITVKSKYDRKAVKALSHLSMFRKKNPKKGMLILALLYGGIFIYVLLMKLWLKEHFQNALPLMAFCAGAYAVMLFGYFINPRLQYNALNHLKELEQTYTFAENSFSITSNNPLYQGNSDLSYSLLYKVMDTENYLFLYQTKRQVFVVDKSTLTQSEADQLRAWIAPVLGKKYIVCHY